LAYIINSVGQNSTIEIEDPGMYSAGVNNFSYNIPCRNFSGNLYTQTPTDDLECTNKKYVDDTIGNSVSEKVKMFHAALDPVTTQYIKDSGDFTYADVLAIENCKIEATYGNITIIFNKEVVRNIQPDPVTGRYVEFSALLRNGPTTVKVFLFVYDPENLPTDPNSVAVLENWGDSQYCGIEVQHIVIGDFLDNDIATGRYNTINAPSTTLVEIESAKLSIDVAFNVLELVAFPSVLFTANINNFRRTDTPKIITSHSEKSLGVGVIILPIDSLTSSNATTKISTETNNAETVSAR
jgi:hypothetical protein